MLRTVLRSKTPKILSNSGTGLISTMDVLPKTAACTHSLHHGHPRNRTEHVRTNSSPRFLRHGGKDYESHHHRFGRHHGHGHRRGEVVEIPAGHILTVVKTAPEGTESTESTGAVSSEFARIVRIGRHGNPGGHGRSYGRHGSPESQEGHGGHGRHGSHAHGGFRGGHRRGEISAGLVAGGETAGEAEKMTADRISERGAGGWKSHGERDGRHGRHGSRGGRGMRHVTNDVSAPVDEPNVDGGDVGIKEA